VYTWSQVSLDYVCIHRWSILLYILMVCTTQNLFSFPLEPMGWKDMGTAQLPGAPGWVGTAPLACSPSTSHNHPSGRKQIRVTKDWTLEILPTCPLSRWRARGLGRGQLKQDLSAPSGLSSQDPGSGPLAQL
jgi:hypothetical protein